MSYQPPVIGSKQLLNFHATSWPDIGGLDRSSPRSPACWSVAVLEWRRAHATRAADGGRPARSRWRCDAVTLRS